MINSPRMHLLIACLVALALAFGGTTAIAGNDDIYENEVAEGSDLTSDDLRDRDLEAFLVAAPQIQDIRASYAQMMAEAEDEQERRELRNGAVEDMTTAIEFTGIDVETYREIGYLYQNDDTVRERINAMAAAMGEG